MTIHSREEVEQTAYQQALWEIDQTAKEMLPDLNLCGFDLFSLPPEIGKLTKLQSLNLQHNRISNLPSEIGKLTKLQSLDLRHNRITSLPSEIGKLTKLQSLDLRHNRITGLPSEIEKLTKLLSLDLHSNQISSLPPEIEKLTKLKQLNLGHNKLRSLPPEIGKLQNLRELNLSVNILSTLPAEIGQLQNLRLLELLRNEIINLPKEIIQLKLIYTYLTQRPSKDPYNLISLKDETEERSYTEGIILSHNPLEVPPIEIVKKGRGAVTEYFKSIEREVRKAINEVKVLLVGYGGSGKTSLLKRFFGEEFNIHESQTHGIDIQDDNIEIRDEKYGDRNIKVNFWDFGGQQIMYATHQFFLSKRSIYILVLDSRKEEDPENWLQQIESFGGDSPILIVINKIDEQFHDIDREFLKNKYKSIKGFYQISCKENTGIEDVIDGLKKTLLSIEHLKTTWPMSWFNVKKNLEKMEEPFIS